MNSGKREENVLFSEFAEGLMRALLGGGGVAGLLEYCRDKTGVGLAFFRQSSAEPVIASGDEEFAERCVFFPMAEILRLYRGWRVDGHGIVGHLVADSRFVGRSSFEELVPLVIDAILLCLKPSESDEPDIPKRGEILSRLLDAPDAEAERLCASLGEHIKLPLDGGFYVMSSYVDLRDPAGKPAPEGLRALFAKYARILDSSPLEAIHAHTGDFFATAFFCAEQKNFGYLLDNVTELFSYYPASLGAGWRLFARSGVGGCGDSPLCFRRSFRESGVAIRHALMENLPGTFAFWENLGAFKLLAVCPDIAGSDLAKAVGELRTLQKAKKTPLFSTLVHLVRNYWNLTATAESLSLHYNSMKYRYDRIEEVLGRALGDERNRFELSLLVRSILYDMDMRDFLAAIS